MVVAWVTFVTQVSFDKGRGSAAPTRAKSDPDASIRARALLADHPRRLRLERGIQRIGYLVEMGAALR